MVCVTITKVLYIGGQTVTISLSNALYTSFDMYMYMCMWRFFALCNDCSNLRAENGLVLTV